MDNLDFWRFCDELNVIQATLLILGQDPTGLQDHVKSRISSERPRGYDACETALVNSIISKRLPAKLKNEVIEEWDSKGENYFDRETDYPDLRATTIQVEDLRTWLIERDINSGFFFADKTDQPDYLDSSHPRYAPKLAAAVYAWLATEDEETTKGKTAKQALVKWLREHAAKYRLSDGGGKPNETGIEECAKVANWQEKGGAPKTPN